MRPILALSLVTLVFSTLLPATALACHNTMYREHSERKIVRTVQERAWTMIKDGKLERAQKSLQSNFPHLSPMRVKSDHVPVMAKAQRDALHALVVTYVRTRKHTHWSTQMLEALNQRKTSAVTAHLAEAYALSDDEKVRDRGWAMLETLNRDRELSDPYTLTLLAVIRIQAGDVTGGRRAFGLAESLRGRTKDFGETVCCVVGNDAFGDEFRIGLGTFGTAGKGAEM